jgi:hypothetical protein
MPFIILGLVVLAMAFGGQKSSPAAGAGGAPARRPPAPRCVTIVHVERDRYGELVRQQLEDQGWQVEE